MTFDISLRRIVPMAIGLIVSLPGFGIPIRFADANQGLIDEEGRRRRICYKTQSTPLVQKM